jgi:hypothetical protein
MLMMALGACLLVFAHAQRPDHQTNLPYGLWARTRGGVLEIGRYEHDGGWTGLFMWTSQHSISTAIPILDGQCGVGVILQAPYTVRFLGGGQQFDTRDGPQVRLRDEYYHDSICGELS